MTLKIFIKSIWDKIQKNDISNIGAMLAYYLLFSIFPFLIFLLNVVGLIASDYQSDIIELLNYLPPNIASLIKPNVMSLINASSGTLLSVSLVITLWMGSKGIVKIMREVSRAFGSANPHNFIVQQLLGVFFTIALSGIILSLVLTNVFGEIIYNFITSLIGENFIVRELYSLLQGIIPLVVMVVVFALLYRFSPTQDVQKKICFIDMLPGALFTSVGWIFITNLFSFYVNNFGRYDATYGSIGGIIVLLLWLYLSSIVMVLGAYISASYVELREI